MSAFLVFKLNQWRSGSALKTGTREVPGSISGCACRPRCSEFSVVFSETRVKTGQDPLERPPRRALPLQAHKRAICLNLSTQPSLMKSFVMSRVRRKNAYRLPMTACVCHWQRSNISLPGLWCIASQICCSRRSRSYV